MPSAPHDARGGLLSAPEIAEWLMPLEAAGSGRKSSPKRVGGKAASLGRLIREGFPVPRGWVIDARRFERDVEGALPRGHDIATLIKLAHTKAGVDRAARARDHILGMDLPDGLRHALEALWKAMEAEAPWGFAARSSATCEDMEETSLAGVAATVLGVRGPEAMGDAVRKVWASAYLPRALAYLSHAGVRELGMAVVLQIVVRAEAAGVLFTAPPPGLDGEHWHLDERLVNATLGLGAPVVEGAATADTVRIAREGGAVSHAVIADKRRALVVGTEGVQEIEVADRKARAPALSREVLREIAALAEKLEARAPALFKATRSDSSLLRRDTPAPLDVEFAVAAEDEDGSAITEWESRLGEAPPRVWLLQARPVTGGGFPEGGDADTVWSRANVGEALPGPATPLTWSIARAFSDRGFHEAFTALGCKVPRDATLVGNVQGRFYLNLSAFMQIAAQVPGLGPRALLTASGGANEAAIALLERQIEDVSHGRFLLRLPFTAPRQIARQARLEREVAAFEAEIDRARRGLFDMDLGILPDDGLATTLRSATQLLERTGTLMLACASASLASHLALCRVLDRVGRRRASARSGVTEVDHIDPSAGWGAAEPIAQALVGGARELDSANPGIALAKMAEIVRADAATRDRLLAGEIHGLADLPDGATRRAVEEFLELYGDRAVREAELATPRWREDATQIIAMLVASLRAPPSDPERALARARALADREMARLETRVSSVELAVVRALVARTQRFTRLRERMRTWVTRVLGMIRTIALDVDRRLRRIDPTLAKGSVFFCTYDELIAALRSGRAEVGHVVRLRRAEHVRDAARPDPPATFIGRPPPILLPPVPGTRLAGLPASAGVVEGRARVLEPGAVGLDAVAAGEILISRTTDVGLSPLFLVAAAVVTELGGPLSHAAVVAREYGIPAVVNVPGATIAIRTGDRLRVDGDRGVVERLDDRAPPSLIPPPETEGPRPA
ncbi:Phosphoenolpyruvate synthase [Minicystis rosea]|nr:Phosphoenolpyruvate synthase [Minicystis rosea]